MGLIQVLDVIVILIEMDKQPIRIDPATGAQHLQYLLETMAKLKIGSSTYFDFFLKDEVEREVEGTDILIITAIVTEKMSEYIKQLEARGNSVEILELELVQPLRQAN